MRQRQYAFLSILTFHCNITTVFYTIEGIRFRADGKEAGGKEETKWVCSWWRVCWCWAGAVRSSSTKELTISFKSDLKASQKRSRDCEKERGVRTSHGIHCSKGQVANEGTNEANENTEDAESDTDSGICGDWNCEVRKSRLCCQRIGRWK